MNISIEKLIDAFDNLCMYPDEGVTSLKIDEGDMTLVVGIGEMERIGCSCHPTWEFTRDKRIKESS